MSELQVHELTPAAGPKAPVVLAVHGITANGLAWMPLTDELVRRRGTDIRVVAPDLRGRAGSRDAAGPYGLRRHADDILELAGQLGENTVVVGHSMGAFVAACASEKGGDRWRGTVLVDGGLAFPAPPDTDVDAALQAVIGPAMERLSMRFATREDYLAYWHRHPALAELWGTVEGAHVERYLLADLVRDGDAHVSSCVLDAVREDGGGILLDPELADAWRRAARKGHHLELLWATRGLQDEPQGLYDADRLAALDVPACVPLREVHDTNHYTIILDRDGVAAVAEAVERHLP